MRLFSLAGRRNHSTHILDGNKTDERNASGPDLAAETTESVSHGAGRLFGAVGRFRPGRHGTQTAYCFSVLRISSMPWIISEAMKSARLTGPPETGRGKVRANEFIFTVRPHRAAPMVTW